MIPTLLVTIIAEGTVVIVFSIWRKKPIGLILITSILANLITQSLLWIALTLFFRHYFVTLLIAEILIWMIESLLLYAFRFNRLNISESLFLSFGMNLASFTLGWVLPI